MRKSLLSVYFGPYYEAEDRIANQSKSLNNHTGTQNTAKVNIFIHSLLHDKLR